MSVREILANLAVACVFHTVGGIAIGFALRKLRQGISGTALFYIVWGAGFGVMPIVIGYDIFQKANLLYLVIVEILVLFSAMGITFFLGSDLFEELQSVGVATIIGGGVFLVMGAIAGFFITRQNLLGGMLFGILFGGSGLFLMAKGVRELLKEK